MHNQHVDIFPEYSNTFNIEMWCIYYILTHQYFLSIQSLTFQMIKIESKLYII